MSLGIYISVPFCKQKCSFCNFVSGVFSRQKMQNYVEKLVADVNDSQRLAGSFGARWERKADSIYLGGGTPTTLVPEQIEQLFGAVRSEFEIAPDAEVTVECAPGTLSDEMLAALLRCGVNRISLGVQSFVDQESHAVGRTHTRDSVMADIARLRNAGITNLSIDLIAGLPHQTRESWEESLTQTIAIGVPHVSAYILEVDDESRLGRELIAGGTRYHAHHVPDDDLCAELYSNACERLNAAGIAQYEISNFARAGFESKHNLKYWTRQPYLGFGLDAHSMLPAGPTDSHNSEAVAAIRLSTGDDLETFIQGNGSFESHCVTRAEALEEELFLGLRLNRGVDVPAIEACSGLKLTAEQSQALEELLRDGLLLREGSTIKLSDRGRLLSNEVFARFIADKAGAVA
jgi:oxygen-independent coproporphyrinogen-3 oxidase